MEEAAACERKLKRQREGEAGPSMAVAPSGEAQYVYVPIADALKAPGARVSIFAVISELGTPFRSRGTDFTITLRITDQSWAAGISVTFFAENTALLPCVRSSGDVISLHNVMITMYRGEFVAAFNKKFSSFALFEGKASTESRPYQTSMKYLGSKYDNEILTQMRMWLLDHLPGLKDNELQLRSIQSDSDFDLVCKVLHICQAPNDEWVFYVWDGTDTPVTEFQTFLDVEAITSVPLHLEEVPLPREELGMWKGTVLPSTKVRLLSGEDGCVIERLKMYDSRVNSQVHRQPMASLQKVSYITDVDYKREGYTTLMESLTHGQVTHKFKTLVRVVAAYPWRGIDLHLVLTRNRCLGLTLEDPTARIHAYVHKDEVARLFGGFLSIDALTKKMNMLLGVPESEETDEGTPLTRNPPWIWCCLKSFRQDKHEPWGSRHYRIFATEIKD